MAPHIRKDLLGYLSTASGRTLSVSFEFFPPRTDEMELALQAAIERLAPLAPTFVSVTYGAGGSTRERTHRTVRRLIEETQLKPAAHLTCIDASRGEVDGVIRDYWTAGVRHIVALRGDPPEENGNAYRPRADGYSNATELAHAIRRIAPFEISVGVYPEVHPESRSTAHDIDVLKAKIDAGASRGISQFFFDVEVFLRFVDRARAAGITIPIVPGIMPVTNFKGLVRMAGKCGTQIPPWLADLFDGLDDDPETRRLVAAAVAADICTRLGREGFNDFHFYTLNRADLVYAICRILGVRENGAAGAA